MSFDLVILTNKIAIDPPRKLKEGMLVKFVAMENVEIIRNPHVINSSNINIFLLKYIQTDIISMLILVTHIY